MSAYTREEALLAGLRDYAATLRDVEAFSIAWSRELNRVRMYFSLARHNILIDRPMSWLLEMDENCDIEYWLYNQIAELIDECED